jgi:valyl-tRNA synthetase
MARLQAVIIAARTIRSEHDVHPRRALPLTLRSADLAVRASLEREQSAIAALCNASVQIGPAGSGPLPDGSAVAVAEGVTLIVPLAGLVDPDKERERLERELKKLDKDLTAVTRKLENQEFLARAPAALVDQERARKRGLAEARTGLEAALARLQKEAN